MGSRGVLAVTELGSRSIGGGILAGGRSDEERDSSKSDSLSQGDSEGVLLPLLVSQCSTVLPGGRPWTPSQC